MPRREGRPRLKRVKLTLADIHPNPAWTASILGISELTGEDPRKIAELAGEPPVDAGAPPLSGEIGRPAMKRLDPLPFDDVDRVAAWIGAVESAVFDLVSVALDVTAQPSRRVLARKTARAPAPARGPRRSRRRGRVGRRDAQQIPMPRGRNHGRRSCARRCAAGVGPASRSSGHHVRRIRRDGGRIGPRPTPVRHA